MFVFYTIQSLMLLNENVPTSFDFLVNGLFYIELLKLSLIEAQKYLLECLIDSNKNLSVKTKIHPRITTIPDDDIKYPETKHVNKFINFEGTVTKAFSPSVLEHTQTYYCLKCNTQFISEIDYGCRDLLVKPAKCPNNDCDSNRFKSVDVDSK